MSTCRHRSDAPFDHTPRRRSRAPRSPLPQRWASAAPTTRVVLKLRPARACIGGASSDAISGMQSLNGNPYNHSPRRPPDGNPCSTQWQSTHSSIAITSPHQVCDQPQSPPLIKCVINGNHLPSSSVSCMSADDLCRHVALSRESKRAPATAPVACVAFGRTETSTRSNLPPAASTTSSAALMRPVSNRCPCSRITVDPSMARRLASSMGAEVAGAALGREIACSDSWSR